MKDKWLDDIHDRLSDFEMEAPAGLWESVEKSAKTVQTSGRKKNVPLWRRGAVAAATVAVVLVCGWQFLHISDSEGDFHMEEYAEAVRSQRSANIESYLPKQPEVAQAFPPVIRQAIHPAQQETEIPVIEDNPGESVDNPGESVDTEENLSIYKGDGDDYVAKKPFRHDNRKNIKKQKKDLFAVGVVTTAGAFGISDMGYGSDFGNVCVPNDPDHSGNLNNSQSPEDLDYSGDPTVSQEPEDKDNPDTDNNLESKGASRRYLPTRSDASDKRCLPDEGIDEITHHMPIKIGLTFLYRFNRTLGLETGLQYTNLKSDIRYGSKDALFSEARQTLHYLGVPVNLKYTPVSWKRLSVYISGGLTFEKCIYGNVKGMLRAGVVTESVRIKERPFQVSANAGAGLQFAITDYCGIYAEPGVGYYFDDGSSLCTVYKDKPWNFNLNVGVRFSFGN